MRTLLTIRDVFVEAMLTGLDSRHSFDLAIRIAIRMLPEGKDAEDLEKLLEDLGFNQLVRTNRLPQLPKRLTRVAWSMWLGPSDGGVLDVPLPDCVQSHLPRDRDPSAEDIKKAWDLCLGRTSK